MRPWAQWTAKTALLAAGFAAAAGGLSGVALAASSNASSGASPGLSLGQLVAPAGVCDDAGALLGLVGAACQAGTAVLPPPWLLFSLCPFRGRGSPHEPAANRACGPLESSAARTPCFSLLLMSRRNRLAQALFRLELRMCGLGV